MARYPTIPSTQKYEITTCKQLHNNVTQLSEWNANKTYHKMMRVAKRMEYISIGCCAFHPKFAGFLNFLFMEQWSVVNSKLSVQSSYTKRLLYECSSLFRLGGDLSTHIMQTVSVTKHKCLHFTHFNKTEQLQLIKTKNQNGKKWIKISLFRICLFCFAHYLVKKAFL